MHHDDVDRLLHGRRNWGRWGADDQVGAVNLITDRKRVDAARLVRDGRTVSLSRPFDVPMRTTSTPRGTGGIATDHYGIDRNGVDHHGVDYHGVDYHGTTATHVDALCHAWDRQGMWQGRNPAVEVTPGGSRWASVEHWRHGIVTRGVLLDVPASRGEPYVTHDRPVRAAELKRIAAEHGVGPGDAVAVYSGRDRWDAEHPAWGTEPDRPGLHADCLAFLRDHDCAVLAWDMLDHTPHADVPWAVHGAIFAYGVAVVDNCDLAPLAAACVELGRHEFLFVLAPLVVPGGTGSPANPLAVF